MDELVKTLRCCGSEDRCKGCPRENDKGKCYDDICIEAADAIEELIKESARWKEEAKDWYLAYMNLLPTRDGYERGKADAEAYLLHCGDTDEPQTNADRIRSMTDEELAKWMASNTDCYYCKVRRDGGCDNFTATPCGSVWLKWLRQEAGE